MKCDKCDNNQLHGIQDMREIKIIELIPNINNLCIWLLMELFGFAKISFELLVGEEQQFNTIIK